MNAIKELEREQLRRACYTPPVAAALAVAFARPNDEPRNARENEVAPG